MLHLGTGDVSLLLDTDGPGLPAVIHWGAPLGELTEAELAAVRECVDLPLQHSALDVPVPVALLPEAAHGFAGRPGLRGHRDGVGWSASFTVTDVTSSSGAATITAADEHIGLHLVIELELPPSGLLRLRHRVRNAGEAPYTVDGLEAALPVPSQAREVLDFTGRWCRERHPQRRSFDAGAWVRESRRGRTGHDATLGLLAGTEGFGFRGGEVWGLHVAWSGNHVTYAQRLPDGRAVLAGGELLLSGEVILSPGEEYTSPWIYAAYSARGLDGISAAFHGWLRSRPHHPGIDRPRPVVLNTWEAVYFDQDLDRLRGLADTAARIGVERFVLDDGWFRHRRDDTAGLGDWYVDEQVWPDGLGPLVDHVRNLGMEFGLWVEPEMVNPDSDLYSAHPDWVLGPDGRRLPPPVRNQQVLDVANPKVHAYLLERLDELLSTYDISYLKWDHNRDLIDAGHEGRAGVHRQTVAVYRLLERLRALHPRVEIESCSSGGGRADLQILEHTDRIWASDCNDALERQAIQRWTGLLLPPELVGTHVGPARAHTTGRTHDLGFRVATALAGHFGIEWDIAAANAQEQALLARAISFYKDLRHLLHDGEVVRADHPDPAAWVHGVVAADRSAALFWYVQLSTSVASVPAAMRLPGLDPHRHYTVSVAEPAGPARAVRKGPPLALESGGARLPGRVLSEVGLQPPILEPEQAWLVCCDAPTIAVRHRA